MDHRSASEQLSDLVLGTVPETVAPSLWAHVGGCLECQQVLETMGFVRRAGLLENGSRSAADAPARSRHPRAEDIVQYALGDRDQEPSRRAEVTQHLLTCHECRREVDLTWRAERRARSPLRMLTRPWRVPMPEARTLGWVAAAAAALVLAYPAYLGVTELPATRRAAAARGSELASLLEREGSLRRELGERAREASETAGPVRLLYLRPATRGTAGEPTITIPSGQRYLPIVLDHDIGQLAKTRPNDRLEVRVTRDSDTAPAWREEYAVARLWDPASQAVSLLVPVAALKSGQYRLELRDPATGRPRVVSGFAIARSSSAE